MVAKDRFGQEAVWGKTELSYVYLEEDPTEFGENCIMGGL